MKKCRKGKILVEGKCIKKFKLAEDKDKGVLKTFKKEATKKWGKEDYSGFNDYMKGRKNG